MALIAFFILVPPNLFQGTFSNVHSNMPGQTGHDRLFGPNYRLYISDESILIHILHSFDSILLTQKNMISSQCNN
jgi:hypothetical protein